MAVSPQIGRRDREGVTLFGPRTAFRFGALDAASAVLDRLEIANTAVPAQTADDR